MSEQLPIKVAPSPQPGNNKASVTAPDDDVSAEKQKEFGGVLSNQVQQQDVDKTQKSADSQVAGSKSASGNVQIEGEEPLPQDGKALPVSPELLELAATEANTELATTTVPVTTDEVVEDAELVLEAEDTAVLAAPVIAVDTKPVEVATSNANSVNSGKTLSSATQTETVARSVATITTPTPTSAEAGEATDDTAQVQAATQSRRAESLEGKVITLAARGDVEKTPFQTNKIIEQFIDVSARPAASANNISAPLPAVSPVTTSSAVSTSATGLQQVSIEVPVQHQQWQRVFAERMVWSVGNNQSISVRVNPAELGPIDIHVNVTKEQANITFNTTHATTRDSIESALPRLREMLASEGLNLGDVDVRHDDGSAQQQRASQDQDGSAGQNGGLDNQEQLAEDQSDVILHPVMISEWAVDYYI